MSNYTYSTQESTKPRTQNDKTVLGAITSDPWILPGACVEQGLAERPTNNISNTPTEGDNREYNRGIGSGIHPANLMGYS